MNLYLLAAILIRERFITLEALFPHVCIQLFRPILIAHLCI